MGEWKEYKLGEIGEIITGKTPSSKNPEEWGDEMLFITPTDYKNYHKYASVSDRKLSLIGIDRFNNKILPPLTLLVTCIGSDMGKVVISSDYCVTNQQINSIIPNTKEFDCDFLYYKLIDLYETLRIYGGDGTAVPIVNKTDFEKIAIEIPNDKKEQKEIADILSSLDDKIDLLNRQNTTLEAMADTLFRHYFIDNAKEDWEEGVLVDIASHQKKSVSPKQKPSTLFYHYSIPSYDNGKEPSLDLGIDIQSSKYVVNNNCILFSKLNPHKDKRIWLITDYIMENSICSTEFQIIKPNNIYLLYYIYGWLSYSENYNELSSGVGGTSGSHQRISPSTIFSFKCQLVDDSDLKEYYYKVKSLFDKQTTNQQQIQTLIRLRDTLLPKLMSNEIKL